MCACNLFLFARSTINLSRWPKRKLFVVCSSDQRAGPSPEYPQRDVERQTIRQIPDTVTNDYQTLLLVVVMKGAMVSVVFVSPSNRQTSDTVTIDHQTLLLVVVMKGVMVSVVFVSASGPAPVSMTIIVAEVGIVAKYSNVRLGKPSQTNVRPNNITIGDDQHLSFDVDA